MRSTAAIRQRQGALLHVLLRRNSVAKAALAAKLGLSACCALLAIWFVHQLRTLAAPPAAAAAVIQRVTAPSTAAAREKPRIDFTRLAAQQIFGELGVPAPAAAHVPAPSTVQTIPLTLVGTSISNEQPAVAIIEAKGRQELFALNDIVFGAARLSGIYPDHVELDRDGVLELLALDESSKTAQPILETTAVTELPQQDLDGALADPIRLAAQARAVPYYKDGVTIGLRIFALRPGSYLGKLGLQNGDVIKLVDGAAPVDISQVTQIFDALKQRRRAAIVAERQGEEKQFQFTVR